MDDRLTLSDIDLLLSAMADRESRGPFTQWISEEVRQNSLARDREVGAKLITLRERAGRGPDDGPGPDDTLTAADVGVLVRSLDWQRRVYERTRWYTAKMMEDALDEVRDLRAKLVALEEEVERAPEC